MVKSKKNGHLNGGNGRDLYHRHYCVNCNSRVYPYDSMEALTVAPQLGASQRQILLFSFNNHQAHTHPNEVSRTAWCWRCDKWVQSYRESRFETQLRYLRRRGIVFRFPNGNIREVPDELSGPTARTFTRVLDQRLEERRVGGGVISLKR